MKKPILATLVITLAFTSTLQAQEKSDGDLMSLSLEELMNVQVVSASKKSENLFEAPLSASVLTREEIRKAGATSIMEALRLIPGVVVREETNGNYDIHIRGLDNVPPNSYQVYSANTTTLVMIDNRPVYNYLQGGTFWETLPIDLNDVEKIEVVRGPSSTLYGPNAVSGVIHIITQKPEKNGWNATANAQYGSLKSTITNASLGYLFNNKFSATVSGNYQLRGRNVQYYNPVSNQNYSSPDSLPLAKPSQSFPHPDRAMDKYGINAFLRYNPSRQTEFSLATGLQNSTVQNAYGAISSSSLSTMSSATQYLDLKGSSHGFTGQFSYLQGKQDPSLGLVGSTFDFHTLDALLEYELKIKHLSLKPGLSYRRATYDDTRYWDASKREGLLSGKRELDSYAGSLRADVKFWGDRIRLTGGLRGDHFTYPNRWFTSYQFAASVAPTSNHFLRAVYSRAYRSPFIYDTYFEGSIQLPMSGNNLPEGSYLQYLISGNKNLALVKSDMAELGYRVKLANNLHADLEAYSTLTSNYTDIIIGATTIQPGIPTVITTQAQVKNIPLQVHQLGATLSLNYALQRFQIKPFVTLQRTTLRDYSEYSSEAYSAPSGSNKYKPQQYNLNSGIGTQEVHKATPSVYGGAFINYQVTPKINFNLNPYFYSAQTFYHRDRLRYNDGVRGVAQINSKLLLNAKISYAPTQSLTVFANVRNLLNDGSREYYYTDSIGSLLLVGLNWHY